MTLNLIYFSRVLDYDHDFCEALARLKPLLCRKKKILMVYPIHTESLLWSSPHQPAPWPQDLPLAVPA